MTEQQLEQAMDTFNEDPVTITMVDNNSNKMQIKAGSPEISNIIQSKCN